MSRYYKSVFLYKREREIYNSLSYIIYYFKLLLYLYLLFYFVVNTSHKIIDVAGCITCNNNDISGSERPMFQKKSFVLKIFVFICLINYIKKNQ